MSCTKKEVENLSVHNAADLCKLAEMLGYGGPPHQLQYSNGACASSLLSFFDDNPGAMESLKDWVLENSDFESDENQEEEEPLDEEELMKRLGK